MNIEKRYWKWNEGLNSTEYKLRADINSFLIRGLVIKSPGESNEYRGINNVPWKITVTEQRITCVFYSEVYFPFPDLDIWELELKDFEIVLSN
jgi:hypothetical protein